MKRDIITGFQWRAVGTLPPIMGAAGCKMRDGRVLIGGGAGADGLLRSTYVFDAPTASLSSGPEMLAHRYGHRMFVAPSGTVVAVGGSASHWIKTRDPPFSRTYEAAIPAEYLDADSGEWRPAESLKMPCVNWCGSTRIDADRVLIAGGLIDQRPTNRAWLISLESLRVLDEFEMPRPRDNDDAVYLPGAGKVILAGGETSYGAVVSWDYATRAWSEDLLEDYRVGLRLVAITPGEALGIGGGLAAAGVDDAVLRWSRGAWKRQGVLALPLGQGGSVTELGPGQLLAIGTNGPADTHSTAQVYNEETRIWTAVSAPSQPRWSHATVAIGNGRVIVFGGMDCRAAELGTPVRGGVEAVTETRDLQ